MSEIFKLKYCPIDGVEVTDANCVFVNSYIGNDSNAGTPALPKKTLGNAITSGKRYVYAIGVFEENINGSQKIYFSDRYFSLVYLYSRYTSEANILNCKIGYYRFNPANTTQIISSCNIEVFEIVSYTNIYTSIRNTYINELKNQNGNLSVADRLTIDKITDISYQDKSLTLTNSIIVSQIDLKYTVFKNCLFFTSTKWLYKGVEIPVSYGNNSDLFLSELKSSLVAYADTLSNDADKNALSLAIGRINSTCKVVDDSAHKTFSVYNADGSVADYSLKLSDENIALTMGSNDGYVGAYKPVKFIELGTITDVDLQGNDTMNTPDFLKQNNQGELTTALNATQLWNRCAYPVESFPRGFTFKGFQSQFTSGYDSRVYLGKLQPLDDKNQPQETIEIEAYDNLTSPSADYPKFSAILNGETQMYYHVASGKPVLFKDLAELGILTTKNLTIYGDWAVTTADYESYLIGGLEGVEAKVIFIFFFRKIVNLHYVE